MDELKRGLKIAVSGPPAHRALAAFRKQARAWGVAMPAVAPLVLDFGLGEFDRTGLIEYWISNEARAGYCGKYLFVFGGQTCPRHRHRVKHETFFIVKGRVRMRSGGRSWIMKAGDRFVVPRGRYHSFTGVGPALLLELSTPCEILDNEFADARIPIGRHHAAEWKRRMPSRRTGGSSACSNDTARSAPAARLVLREIERIGA